jgi:putative endonuclease
MHSVLGPQGETLAAEFLAHNGYFVLDRNYRFAHAELDLVCFQPWATGEGGDLVFVEVKTRTGTRFGTAEEAVTEAKKRHLRRAAEAYLYERKLDGAPARFDVVCVDLGGGEPTITHHENAFGMMF